MTNKTKTPVASQGATGATPKLPKPEIWGIMRYVAVGALVFQVVHFIEHAAQLSFWFMNPGSSPWLTPWAETGRDLLVVDGTLGSGNELLHLIGNLVFMAGLAALVVVARSKGRTPGEVTYLKPAILVQGFHVIEHVALTVSYLTVGSAIGVSTLFGTAQGAFGSSLRIWAHFLLNLVATYYAVRAAIQIWQPGFQLRRLNDRPARLS